MKYCKVEGRLDLVELEKHCQKQSLRGVEKGVLRNFAKVSGKRMGRPATLLKKRLRLKCFLVSFAKF